MPSISSIKDLSPFLRRDNVPGGGTGGADGGADPAGDVVVVLESVTPWSVSVPLSSVCESVPVSVEITTTPIWLPDADD